MAVNIDTVDLMHVLGVGWLPFTFPTLVGSYLVNQCLCSRNVEREEGTTHYCVDVVLSLLSQAMEEVPNNQPFLHAVVWASLNVILETLPDFWDGLILELLNPRDPVPEGIGLAHWKVYGQECIGTSFLLVFLNIHRKDPQAHGRYSCSTSHGKYSGYHNFTGNGGATIF